VFSGRVRRCGRGMGTDAVQQQPDDLLGGQGDTVGDAGVAAGEADQPHQPGHLLGLARELVAVGAHQVGDGLDDLGVVGRVAWVLGGPVSASLPAVRGAVPGTLPRRCTEPQDRDQLDDAAQPLLQERCCLQQPLLQRLVRRDGPDLLHDRARVEGRLRGRADQRVLVGEDAEDGALGHAGRLGDLTGRDLGAVLADQREGGVDERGAAQLGRHRRRAAGCWGCHASDDK
jgi:hypothetical protein